MEITASDPFPARSPGSWTRLCSGWQTSECGKGGTRPSYGAAHQGMSRAWMKVGDGFPGLRGSDITIHPVSALHFLPR